MRALTDHERAVLVRLVAEDFPGADELRSQVASARVVGGCECGCPTIDLVVDDDVRLAAVASRTPVSANVEGSPDEGLIVFVDEGRLSGLELYGAWERPPSDFPDIERLQPYVLTRNLVNP